MPWTTNDTSSIKDSSAQGPTAQIDYKQYCTNRRNVDM